MENNDFEMEELAKEEKRELRRQRRVRNQTMAIIGLIVSVIILAVVIVFGIHAIRSKLNEKEQQEIMEEQLSQIEEEQQEAESQKGQTLEEESAAATEEYTEEEVLDEVVEACISEMTLEEKVAGLFIVTPEAITGVETAIQAGDGTKTALEKYPVGGLIYFTKNIKSEEQIKEMIANSVSYAKYPLFIAVDEEGGKVSRVAEALKLENVGDMADIGSSGDTNKAYEAMQKVGTYLSSYGFNLDFAPVADVLTNADNTSIGERSFSSDAAVAASMAASATTGLEDTGISACMKHFPGLGDAADDTHNGMAVVDKTLDELKATELLPFAAGIEAGVDMIMVGHVSLPQVVGDNTPATMSKEVISNLLRSEMGYNGVVITDAMNMGAITEYYGADEAAIKALKAGADMILMPEDFKLAYEGVVEAVKDGTISEERIDDSLTRVYRIKYRDSVGE